MGENLYGKLGPGWIAPGLSFDDIPEEKLPELFAEVKKDLENLVGHTVETPEPPKTKKGKTAPAETPVVPPPPEEPTA